MRPKKQLDAESTPRSQILLYLVELSKKIIDNKSKRTHNGIHEGSKLGKQTVYDSLEQLMSAGLVREEIGKKWRTGHPLRYYYLTPQGWYKVSLLKPELTTLVKNEMQKLGGQFDEYKNKLESAKQANINQLLETIREILNRRELLKDWSFNLKITSGFRGRPSFLTWANYGLRAHVSKHVDANIKTWKSEQQAVLKIVEEFEAELKQLDSRRNKGEVNLRKYKVGQRGIEKQLREIMDQLLQAELISKEIEYEGYKRVKNLKNKIRYVKLLCGPRAPSLNALQSLQ